MTTLVTPAGLADRGTALWAALAEVRDLAGGNATLAEEACRIADRLDGLDDVIRGKGVLKLMHFRSMLGNNDPRHIILSVDEVFAEARQQANTLRQIVAGLPVKGEGDDDAGERFLAGLST